MVRLLDAPIATDMTEVEQACWLAGKGNVEPLAKIVETYDRPLTIEERYFIARYVRGGFKPGPGRPSNASRSTYERSKTRIELAVEMVRKMKGERSRFVRGELDAALSLAAKTYSITVDQVAAAYRRRK